MGDYLVLSNMADFNCKMCGGCCGKGWHIYLSEVEYRKLLQIFDEDLLKEATEILPPPQNEAGYARFVEKNGDCRLKENNLCQIHKNFGLAYLPYVCTIFPRRIFVTPRGTEISVTFSCPETQKLLLCKEKIEVLKNPPGFFFDVSHLILPSISEELLNAKDETKWYFTMEEAVIKILQDRVFTLDVRMATVGMLIHSFHKYADDQTRQNEYPQLLKNYRALARQVGGIKPQMDYQVRVLKKFLDFKKGLGTSTAEFYQIAETVFGALGLSVNKPVQEECFAFYQGQLQKLYNERELGYITGNYLVCNVFSKLLYIFGLEAGFYALAFFYSLIRFLAVGLATAKGVPVDEEIIMQAISVVDHNVRHTAGFTDHFLLSQGIEKYEPEYFSPVRAISLVLS